MILFAFSQENGQMIQISLQNTLQHNDKLNIEFIVIEVISFMYKL